MPQIRAGTATITTGQNRVIGDANTNWAETIPGFSLFALVGYAGIFVVQTKTAPDQSQSQFWELTLTANYNGPTVTAVPYIIHKDFSPGGLALLSPGDQFGFQIQNRNMLLLDVLGIGGGGGLSLSIYNADQGLYFQIYCVGAAGEERLTLSEEGTGSRFP